MTYNYKYLISFFLTAFGIVGCKKAIEIPPPVGTVTTSQVFSTDGQAASAASGMYYNMINNGESFSSYSTTIFSGMSADELIPFDRTINVYVQFQMNDLSSTNGIIGNDFWQNAYSSIYAANAIIEGLKSYSGVHDSVKNELTGEAEFIRAFCNFYLVNLFGDIPLVTTINWQKTNLLPRTPAKQIYRAIIADLRDAQSRMAPDYSVGLGQRIVPNKWGAAALLARVYLYTGDWVDAEAEASSVIGNSTLYTLTTDLNQVFLINSTESIWQLQQSNENSFNATPEGAQFIPAVLNSDGYSPFAYLTPELLNAFEPNDLRLSSWVDSTLYGGVEYYFPYKYKMGSGQATAGGPYSEYYTVLRLAEQYLIRAEARTQQNKLSDAATDLNTIRSRANLLNTTATTKDGLLAAIAHERQIELFAEWGHRWMDLKRTNQATSILSPIKPLWTPNSQLYPIPTGELVTDPNLIQNPGYQ